VVDVLLGGEGLSFKIKLSTANKDDEQNFFKVDRVSVDVKNFNIKVKQSNHKALFALFKPFMLKVIRPALQKALEKTIKDNVHQFDSFAYQVKLEADKAQREIANDPQKAPNIYSRYTSAAQRELVKNKRKAQEMVGDKKVNMAVTKHDSIFPDIHLQGGISSKAAEYKELAMKGNKWESSVFSLGSASASTNIPKAGTITRKPHAVNEGGVRGTPNVGNTSPMTNNLHDSAAQNGTTNGSAAPGFRNQVDQAFSNGGPLKPTNGTTLGASNPVLTGST